MYLESLYTLLIVCYRIIINCTSATCLLNLIDHFAAGKKDDHAKIARFVNVNGMKTKTSLAIEFFTWSKYAKILNTCFFHALIVSENDSALGKIVSTNFLNTL